MRGSPVRRDAPAAAGPAAAPTALPRGVRAAKQQRSRDKQAALLEAGRRLLLAHDLQSLTVAQVAAAAGVAVGSFYTRFEDKNAWFDELCRQAGEAALADMRQLLSGPAMQRAAPPRQVALLMDALVALHRDHQGLFRAAVSDPARTARYWTPLMLLTDQVVALACDRLLPGLRAVPALPARGLPARLRFAFQVVLGTLVNAVLHDGGPVRLHDAALPRELTRVFLAAVGWPLNARPVPASVPASASAAAPEA